MIAALVIIETSQYLGNFKGGRQVKSFNSFIYICQMRHRTTNADEMTMCANVKFSHERMGRSKIM